MERYTVTARDKTRATATYLEIGGSKEAFRIPIGGSAQGTIIQRIFVDWIKVTNGSVWGWVKVSLCYLEENTIPVPTPNPIPAPVFPKSFRFDLLIYYHRHVA